MSDRPVRLILDASAIVAFTRESIHVGRASTLLGADGSRWRELAAIDLDVDVLTRQPRLYGGMADGGPVVPV